MTHPSAAGRGGITVIAGQVARIVIQLGGVVVLSRLLTPESFGLVAMVAVAVALGDLLRDFGLPTAALRAPHLTSQQASNLFWASSGLGVVAAVLLTASTPVLVWLYQEPLLAPIVPAMATSVVFNAVQSQIQVQLARASRYRAIAKTDVFSNLVGLAIGIVAAVLGLAYWALVLQVVTVALSLVVSRALLLRWIPARPRRRHGTAAFLRSGGHIGLAGLLTFLASNADSLVIGAHLGAVSLGRYNRGFQIYMLPRAGILDPLTQVVLPSVSRAVEGGETPSRALLRVQSVVSIPFTLAYVVLAAGADWIVPLLLGDQWTTTAPVVVALSTSGVFAVLGIVCYWMFVVTDNTRRLLHLHLVTKPLAVAAILISAPFGIVAVAWGFVAAVALAWPINILWLRRVPGFESGAFFLSGVRMVAASSFAILGAQATKGLIVAISAPAGALAVVVVATTIYLTVICASRAGRRDLMGLYTAALKMVAHA